MIIIIIFYFLNKYKGYSCGVKRIVLESFCYFFRLIKKKKKWFFSKHSCLFFYFLFIILKRVIYKTP